MLVEKPLRFDTNGKLKVVPAARHDSNEATTKVADLTN